MGKTEEGAGQTESHIANSRNTKYPKKTSRKQKMVKNTCNKKESQDVGSGTRVAKHCLVSDIKPVSGHSVCCSINLH